MRAWGIYANTLLDGEENWKENRGENMAEFQNIVWQNVTFIVFALGSCKGHYECHSGAQVLPLAQTLSCPQHVNASLCWGYSTSSGMSRDDSCVWEASLHTHCTATQGQLWSPHRRAAPLMTFSLMVTSDDLATVPYMHTFTESAVISEQSLHASWSWTQCLL